MVREEGGETVVLSASRGFQRGDLVSTSSQVGEEGDKPGASTVICSLCSQRYQRETRAFGEGLF